MKKVPPKLEELVLPNSKLRFCSEQLQNLNFLFNKKVQVQEKNEKLTLLAKSVTERLVQRLLCSVGEMDHRFASKFLVSLDRTHGEQRLEYIVRLDYLSLPPIYKKDATDACKYVVVEKDPEYPPGYARVRFSTHSMKSWSDFINSGGYLRRDKIQSKFVELLAKSASVFSPDSPLQVDESLNCGIPGKVVDPVTLHHVLRIPTDEHVFYGPNGSVPRFPDPRDFKIAIVDEPDGIKIRVEFLSPALSSICIQVRLLVAIGLDYWPSATDFPSRIPLGHVDCVLYQRAAQTGMFLVGYGVQSSAWQIRLPAAEYTILNHYSANSTVTTVLDVLYECLEDVRKILFRSGRNRQLSYDILNRYILQTTLLKELEVDQPLNPAAAILSWSPLFMSTHVLKILDKLMLHLKEEKLSNYFFGAANLLVNPGHLCDDDFVAEAQKIRALLLRFFDESLMSTKDNEEFKTMTIAQNSEMLLLTKWTEILEGLLPPKTRDAWCCGRHQRRYTQYTLRQQIYIGLVLKNMLKVKQRVLQASDSSPFEEAVITHVTENPLEDVVYLLVTIMEQASIQFLPHTKNKPKFKSHFEAAASKLVEAFRKDKEVTTLDLNDDETLVKIILGWLYKGLQQKPLRPILKPYLNALFHTSHAASWHLEYLRDGTWGDEMATLGMFAKLVNSGEITPAQGLIDAYNKNWQWAREMLGMIEKESLRIVLIPEKGKVVRHILSLPSYKKKNVKVEEVVEVTKQHKTLPARNYFSTILRRGTGNNQNQDTPQHDILKQSSSMNLISSNYHRKGDHRCCGDILQALLVVQKVNILKDVSTGLPSEERVQLLETIHDLTNRRRKKSLSKKWSTSLPQLNNVGKVGVKNGEAMQRYIPKEESAGISLGEVEDVRRDVQKKKGRVNPDSLIGSCREARMREDSGVFQFHEDFRVKSLIRLREMFK